MGVCSNIFKPTGANSNQMNILYTYPRSVTVSIKKLKDEHSIIEKFDNILSEPCFVQNEAISFFSHKVHISQCILPGFDPRGTYFKKCQDSCYVTSTDSLIFISLFDGHGTEGEKISFFCASYAEKYLKSTPLTPDIESFLLDLTASLNQALSETSQLNSLLSGSTAVFIIITSSHIHTASVGDSRAILAKNKPHIDLVPKAPVTIQLGNSYKKPIPNELVSNIYAIQLTKDQRPENPEELPRLLENGARVKRIVDENGHHVGPYRVWEMNSNIPGLSMSRSIGDQIAKNLGVVATPIITEIELNFEHDLFLVIASDGLWDTMDNHDVCNFVEYHRTRCLQEFQKIPKNEEISCSNASVAQLLCEEARMRWIDIVEEEDVMVDDISCVIVELKPGNLKTVLNQRKEKIGKNLRDIDSQNLVKEPTLQDFKMKDPKRGAMIYLD